eukprot:TRINITY_DN1272_c0_g1_i2.p2 TRINITY_DN1272_c0_g1~~TRINITY_DN1272_c0_g1_i2.p2  ORF type:complete len:981 (-),score=225.29 TRINITY_DN1272_c0_g1_i2:5645-8587(-)
MTEESNNSHFFELIIFTDPHWCGLCSSWITPETPQGYLCKTCHLGLHKKCSGLITNDCGGRPSNPSSFPTTETKSALTTAPTRAAPVASRPGAPGPTRRPPMSARGPPPDGTKRPPPSAPAPSSVYGVVTEIKALREQQLASQGGVVPNPGPVVSPRTGEEQYGVVTKKDLEYHNVEPIQQAAMVMAQAQQQQVQAKGVVSPRGRPTSGASPSIPRMSAGPTPARTGPGTSLQRTGSSPAIGDVLHQTSPPHLSPRGSLPANASRPTVDKTTSNEGLSREQEIKMEANDRKIREQEAKMEANDRKIREQEATILHHMNQLADLETKLRNMTERLQEASEPSPLETYGPRERGLGRQASGTTLPPPAAGLIPNAVPLQSTQSRAQSKTVSAGRTSDVTEYEYFMGSIDRKQAEDILQSAGSNTYLLRNSSVEGSYAVSFNSKIRGFNHTLIVPAPGGGYKFQDIADVHPTVDELLKNSHEFTSFSPVNRAQYEQKSEVKILISEVNQVASIATNANVQVTDLIRALVMKVGLKGTETEYGLYQPEENLWLPNNKYFSSFNYPNQKSLLLQRRDSIHIELWVGGKKVTVNLRREATVKDAIEAAKTASNITTSNMGLFLVQKPGEVGTLLDDNKAIRSYKIKNSITLELKDRAAAKKQKEMMVINVNGPSGIIMVEAVQDQTLAELREDFLKRNPVENPSGYGFQKCGGGKRSTISKMKLRTGVSAPPVQWLDEKQSIKSLGMKSGEQILFRQKDRFRTASSADVSNMVIKNPVFGVDPATLRLVEDSGYKVPFALVQLKEAILANKGLEQEGIFRMSGSESKMKDIKFLLNTNRFQGSNDAHACAGLIKRWFGELPRRILSTVPPSVVESAMDDINDSMNIAYQLPGLDQQLFLWILDLMSLAAQYHESNKMSPENLAICIAPQFYDLVVASPMEALIETQKYQSVVRNAIFFKTKEKDSAEMSSGPSEPVFSLEASGKFS